jgi:hypothetical protein
MPQSESSRHDEQLDENPYAPPMADIKPAADEAGTDQAGNQRTKHLRRESCIRVTGLFGLILAGLVVLSFGLGSLSELYRQDEEGIPSWMFRRWVARMICLISISVLAFVTNWGLFRLRNWGRWGLTISTMLPVPVLVGGWILQNLNANPGLQESLDSGGLTALSVMSALSCPLLLFIMWSPKGEMVFSPEYSEIIRQTPRSRPGCFGILAALAFAFAELISFTVLLMTVLSIMAMLELIRSV